MVLRLPENPFAIRKKKRKKKVDIFNHAPPRSNSLQGSFHHPLSFPKQREITYSRQAVFFSEIYPPSRKGDGGGNYVQVWIFLGIFFGFQTLQFPCLYSYWFVEEFFPLSTLMSHIFLVSILIIFIIIFSILLFFLFVSKLPCFIIFSFRSDQSILFWLTFLFFCFR